MYFIIVNEVPTIDFSKYPFLKDIGEELKKFGGGVTLNDILESKYLEVAKERLEKIIKDEKVESFSNVRNSVLVFYSLILIVALLNNRSITENIAKKESKLIESDLIKENPENLLEIGKLLGVNVSKDELKFSIKDKGKERNIILPFSIPLTDYLFHIREIKRINENFKLNKRIVTNGKVYINKADLTRLLREKIRLKIIELINSIKLPSVPDNLKKIADELRGRKTPPCIVELRKKKELTDEEKRILVVYSVNVNEVTDELDKELVAKFRGNRRERYIVYSCEIMKKLNLCVAECGVKNPLELYYGRLLS
ncbi:DNA primase regulatory subunit PriL [Sulfolobus acidocaldarius]|uniref:DNA primase large subunit PriL n=3 Tax=Sulfolobus acidocaldarius TaxID=2285 RepID=A0A0U3FUN1_9CREN|nr:DNA primase regulatory subunit PriL [Sulfolobus acidocaldarius]WCM35367.1 DNA primase regulatory subunit PriL [Sulfolobus acidocaldarius DSM 639]AGE71456.1 DNA primase large subunit [Sulfolobus acidocaldarius N8]AGE73729.1 DNA primase large subunit [Sulfolobus acidocaldarius Ron12/I]ALU30309.1 DNA primase [Sulfolobus acidocaldarius]ALU31027.1 DNA primase [Sulfolobus acidocaldarius]